MADQKCLDSLFQNDLSSIQSGSKSAGDLVNGVQTVMQETPDFPSVKQLLDGNFISEGEKKGYTKEAIPKPYEGKTEFLTSATVVPQVLEGTLEDVDKKREIIRNGYSSLVQGAESPIQSPGSAIHANDVAISEQNSKTDAISPSNIDFTLIGNVPKDIDNEVYPPTRIENEGMCMK